MTRTGCSTPEEADAIDYLSEKYSTTEVAKRLGRSNNFIRQRLKLAELIEGFKVFVHNGDMTFSLGVDVAPFASEEQQMMLETIGRRLTMTSGIAWNEDYEDPNSDVAQMYQSPCENNESHILTYMKPLKFEHQPGTHWNYSTGETDLVGILIQKATGKSLADYLSEKIWQPWGMENCAYWLADECSNLNMGGSGLSASLRDYARLGTLMLNSGKHEDESIFSEEWLDDATSLLYETNDQGGGYGYLWWRFKNGSYAAVGVFGQMLYIDPHKDLVIVQIAAWPKASSDNLTGGRQAFIEAVHRVID